ncbi:hypothetical protein [Gimesia aquarii]|uniref:Uncharacterized protein n=1 Tax=Gimesia aquarii TaxID=2527964 RepID=A0A517W4R6_9PLAN|nr:hypothetical protein [Gimesia aquarii]QDU00247.1 hypothetical protein V144x_57600 [Gimesia aquarii]
MKKTSSLRIKLSCGIVAVLSTVLFGNIGFAQRSTTKAQQKTNDPFGQSLQPVPIQQYRPSLSNPARSNSRYIGHLFEHTISQKLQKLRQELKNAKSNEQKEEVEKSVREALLEYFNKDMKHREAELEKLMLRSSKMSAALEKRAAAKEQLVDLQLKSFKYEMDGLGLFTKQGLTSQWKSATRAYPTYTIVNSFDSEGLYLEAAKPKVDPLKTAMDTVNTMLQKLRSEKSDEGRTKATSELRKALSNYFDLDLKARQKEIDKINAGLKKMQTGLQKRADAKDNIVDLQLQIIVNEAKGLGFFRSSALNSAQHGIDLRLPALDNLGRSKKDTFFLRRNILR